MKEKKTKNAIARNLREQLAKAANGYALELHRQWGMEVTAEDYWIGGGGYPCDAPYSLRTLLFLSLGDIQYIVENSLTFDQVTAWQDYLLQAYMIGIEDHQPSLKEYIERPERLLQPDAIERLKALKDDLDAAVNEELAKTNAHPY